MDIMTPRLAFLPALRITGSDVSGTQSMVIRIPSRMPVRALKPSRRSALLVSIKRTGIMGGGLRYVILDSSIRIAILFQTDVQQLFDAVSLAISQVYGLKGIDLFRGQNQAIDEVVNIDQVPDIIAGPPNFYGILPFHHLPDRGRHHMGRGEVEVIIGPVYIGWTNYNGPHGILELFHIEPAQDLRVPFHPGHTKIDVIGVSVEHLFLADKPVSRWRIGRVAAQEDEFLDLGEVGGLERLARS